MIPNSVLITVASLAPKYGVSVAGTLAFLRVESRMSGCEADGTPIILCEPAQFYSRLPAAKRSGALKLGLAMRKWRPGIYGPQAHLTDREALFARMIDYDEKAAYESVSMGMGQIMGWHAAGLGFGSAQGMYAAFTSNEPMQIEAMLRLFKVMGIVGAINARDWPKVAKNYNGAGYRRNKYDDKLAAAYSIVSLQLKLGRTAAPAPGTLDLGSSGPAVAVLQQALVDKGLPVKVDGEYGGKTMDAVSAVQTRTDITGQGQYDEQTAVAFEGMDHVDHGSRTLATISKLKETSEIVATASVSKIKVWITTVGTVGSVVAGAIGVHKPENVGDAVDQFNATKETYGKVADVVGDDRMAAVVAWVVGHPLAILNIVGLLIVSVIVTRDLLHIQRIRVAKEQDGESAS